jgi:hypothetical protein
MQQTSSVHYSQPCTPPQFAGCSFGRATVAVYTERSHGFLPSMFLGGESGRSNFLSAEIFSGAKSGTPTSPSSTFLALMESSIVEGLLAKNSSPEMSGKLSNMGEEV